MASTVDSISGYNPGSSLNDNVPISVNLTLENTTVSDDCEAEQPLLPAAWYGVLAAAAFVGLIGNLLIILSVLLTPRQRKRSNILVTNLAVADIIVCSVVIPVLLLTSLNTFDVASNTLLHAVVWLAMTCCVASVVTSVLVAVERYFHICHIVYYRKVFTPQYIALFASLAWIYSLILSSVGTACLLASDCNETKTFECFLNSKRGTAFGVTSVVLVVLLPVCVMSFCYFSILHLVCRNRLALRNHERANRNKPPLTSSQLLVRSTTRSPSRSPRRRNRRSGNVELMLLTIIIFFLLFWSPLAVVVMLHVFNAPVTSRFSAVAAWLALCNSAANSFVYGVLNTNFRQTYSAILTRIFCCRAPPTAQARTEHGDVSHARAARDQLHSQFSLSNTMWRVSQPSTRSDLTHSKVSSGDLQIMCETSLRNGVAVVTSSSAKYGAFLDVPAHNVAAARLMMTSDEMLAVRCDDVEVTHKTNIPAIRISVATASADSGPAEH